MKFIIGFMVVYVALWIADLLGESQSKAAKNYEELMKRPAFKPSNIDEE